jgi:hypothetical protein
MDVKEIMCKGVDWIQLAQGIRTISSFSRKTLFHVGGPFEKFVDSLYFSESELCGGVMTASFSMYLP